MMLVMRTSTTLSTTVIYPRQWNHMKSVSKLSFRGEDFTPAAVIMVVSLLLCVDFTVEILNRS